MEYFFTVSLFQRLKPLYTTHLEAQLIDSLMNFGRQAQRLEGTNQFHGGRNWLVDGNADATWEGTHEIGAVVILPPYLQVVRRG